MTDFNNLMNLNSNPYMNMIKGGQQEQQQQMQQQGSQQMETPDDPEEDSQYMRGKTGDKAKPLMMAIQGLQNYIAASTEREDILTARGLIGLLTKLMAKDQEDMMKK